MSSIRVTWSESGIEHQKIVNGVENFSDAAWLVALEEVEDPTNAKLVGLEFLVPKGE